MSVCVPVCVHLCVCTCVCVCVCTHVCAHMCISKDNLTGNTQFSPFTMKIPGTELSKGPLASEPSHKPLYFFSDLHSIKLRFVENQYL